MPTTTAVPTKTTSRDRIRYNVKRSDAMGSKKESVQAPKSPKPKGTVSVSKVSARKPSSTKIAKDVAANDSKSKVLKEEVVNVETEVQGDLIIKRETVVRTLSPAKEATEGTFKLRKAADDAPLVAQPGRNAVIKTLHDGKAIDLKTDAKYTKDMPRERVLIKKRDSTPTTRFPEGERTPGSEEAGRTETFVRETVTRRPPPVDLTPAPAPAPPPPPPPPRPATPPPPPEPKPEPAKPKSPVKPTGDGGDNKGATRQRTAVLLNQNLHRKDGFSKTQPFKPGQKLQDDVVIIKKKEVKYDKDNNPIEDIDEVVRVKAYEDGACSPKSPKRASVVKK